MITIENWGLISYSEAWERQTALFDELIDAKLNGKPYTNRIIFCQHPHVYTLGKHGKAANMLLNPTQLQTIYAELFQVDRGGDITYHGPGQWVCYPILNLEDFHLGLKEYLHLLEEAVIRVCRTYGIETDRVHGATGVWLATGTPEERKICAMGVRSSHFVTMHGLALNVNTDVFVKPFSFSLLPTGKISFYLFVDLLHTFYGRMPSLLVDSFQFDARHVIVCADGLYRLIDFRFQVAVQQKINLHVGITVLHVFQHISHGRTEAVQIFFRPVFILVFTDRSPGPAVVRCSKNENEVRTPQVVHSCHKRAVGIILFPVTGVADGCTRERIVYAQTVSAFLNKLIPPGLVYRTDIVVFPRLLKVPHGIGIRLKVILESRVRIS